MMMILLLMMTLMLMLMVGDDFDGLEFDWDLAAAEHFFFQFSINFCPNDIFTYLRSF